MVLGLIETEKAQPIDFFPLTIHSLRSKHGSIENLRSWVIWILKKNIFVTIYGKVKIVSIFHFHTKSFSNIFFSFFAFLQLHFVVSDHDVLIYCKNKISYDQIPTNPFLWIWPPIFTQVDDKTTISQIIVNCL